MLPAYKEADMGYVGVEDAGPKCRYKRRSIGIRRHSIMIQMNSSISAYTDKHFTSGQTRQYRQNLLSDFGQVMEKKRQEIDIRLTIIMPVRTVHLR